MSINFLWTMLFFLNIWHHSKWKENKQHILPANNLQLTVHVHVFFCSFSKVL